MVIVITSLDCGTESVPQVGLCGSDVYVGSSKICICACVVQISLLPDIFVVSCRRRGPPCARARLYGDSSCIAHLFVKPIEAKYGVFTIN